MNFDGVDIWRGLETTRQDCYTVTNRRNKVYLW